MDEPHVRPQRSSQCLGPGSLSFTDISAPCHSKSSETASKLSTLPNEEQGELIIAYFQTSVCLVPDAPQISLMHSTLLAPHLHLNVPPSCLFFPLTFMNLPVCCPAVNGAIILSAAQAGNLKSVTR